MSELSVISLLLVLMNIIHINSMSMWELMPSNTTPTPSRSNHIPQNSQGVRDGFWGTLLQHSSEGQKHNLQQSETSFKKPLSQSVPLTREKKRRKIIPESLRSLHTIYTDYDDFDEEYADDYDIGNEVDTHEEQVESVLRTQQITANTLAQLQKRVGPLPDHSSSMGRNKKQKQENMISANPGTNAIMNMIKNLQEEIEEIDKEIERENSKSEVQKNARINPAFLEDPISSITKESTAETVKELKLQKEDDNIKKMMAQMTLMKQIQKKEEENRKLELALQKLNERRNLINNALKRQKVVAEEKRNKAFADIEKQKRLLEETRKRTKSPSNEMKREEEIFQKADMLEAHKLLVDKSNKRILERIEEIKVSRQRDALAEQERLVKEQQLAINLLRKMQSRRKQIQKQDLRKKPRVTNTVLLSLAEQLQKLKQTKSSFVAEPDPDPEYLLDPDDKKQVQEWIDLEKNAAILHKTDKAIAQKLRSEESSELDLHTDTISSEEDLHDLLRLMDVDELKDVLDNDSNSSDFDLSSVYDQEEDYEEYFDFGESLVSEAIHPRPQPPASNVRTQVRRYPGGRVSTKVSIGIATPRPHIQRIGPQQLNLNRHRPRSFSDLMVHESHRNG